MAYDVIVSGHLCADLIPDTSNLPLEALASAGKLFEMGALTLATGGAVSNTGVALHRLGVKVGLMTGVGDDLLGRVIIAKLKDCDPSLGDLITTRPNVASSYSVILSPRDADRIILHCPGNNVHFDLPDVDLAVVQQSKIFYLGYPPLLPKLYANDGEALAALFQRVHDLGVVTALDMTHPDPGGPSGRVNWVEVLHRVLPFVDVFLPSIEEIVFMLRRADYDRWHGAVMAHLNRAYLRRLADELIEMGAAVAGLKLGEYGFYMKTASDPRRFARFDRLGGSWAHWGGLEHWHPVFKVNVVGAIGAGDCAYAGFLMALLRGFQPQEALRFACAVGASNVEYADATSGVQSCEATLSRINAGWDVSSYVLPEV